VIENPDAKSIKKNKTTWNQSIPKKYRYNGTAVSERNSVPIRNELTSQLTLLKGN
jgi:hypothetical protein